MTADPAGLKPCPFCGTPNPDSVKLRPEGWEIHCARYDASIFAWYYTRAKGIEDEG